MAAYVQSSATQPHNLNYVVAYWLAVSEKRRYLASYKYIHLGMWLNDTLKIPKWFVEKLLNLFLLDTRVISFKDWKKIKKFNKKFYHDLRSNESYCYCYDYTFDLVSILKNPKVRLIWLCAVDVQGKKYGHAVIEKNGFIYDTNLRRTFSKDKYLKISLAEIYREYSLEEYQNLKAVHQLDWDDFGKWCMDRNAERNI